MEEKQQIIEAIKVLNETIRENNSVQFPLKHSDLTVKKANAKIRQLIKQL